MPKKLVDKRNNFISGRRRRRSVTKWIQKMVAKQC